MIQLFKKNLQKGFTLIEMIVVIALISVVSTLVLFNNAKLNSAILISNTAYEIGLMIREAQVAGLGVSANTGTNQFIASHGLYINIANPKEAILFSDKDNNRKYDNGEENQIYTIENNRAGEIFAICKKSDLISPSPVYCTGSNSLTEAHIIFTRPNPEAFFKIPGSIIGSYEEYTEGALVINIGFENDICRSVVAEKTGAVEIKTTHCPPVL